MRMVFDSEEHDGFRATREELERRFDQWVVDERRAPGEDAALVAGDAGLALDWKWSYADGDLGSWQPSDVAEFLLEWCPRKLSVSPGEAATIPVSLAAFFAFLDATGLLAPASAPVTALVDATIRLTDEFVAAMGDESNFGMAKSLFGAATAEGVDLSDPEELDRWMNDFNARPEEERRRLMAGAPAAPPARPALPPVAMPDDAEIAASKAAAPILAMFARLAAFVGDGRKLTKTGNLTLGDARELVVLLGTGDTMDPVIGDRTFKTTSSAELVRLRQVFTWAKKTGVLRVAHGKVVATKRGLAIGTDPAACFDRAADALMAIGPLTSQRATDRWLAWPEVDEMLDRIVIHLMTGPYVLQRPMPLEDLVSDAVEAVLEAFEFRSLADDHVARRVGYDMVDIVDALELAGIVRRDGKVGDPDPEVAPGRTREGGTVELTPAGVVTIRRLLAKAGYDTPAAGRLADATATELLAAVDPDDLPSWWGEIQAWRRRRSPAEVARQLAGAVRELGDPGTAEIALALLGELDPAVAGPEVWGLTADPTTRGFALCWLVDHGLAEASALFDPTDVDWFVDVLAQRAAAGGL
ncbi:MAG: hypothetical protein ACR2HM_06540 [Acidimicrobiales bacterium]